MLRLATQFIPDDACWAPGPPPDMRIPCLPRRTGGNAGLAWNWWRFGGMRAGAISDPVEESGENQPHQPASDPLARSPLLRESDGMLEYVPCTCAAGGQCSFFSPIDGALELYTVSADAGAAPAYSLPKFDEMYGGTFGAHDTTVYECPKCEPEDETCLRPCAREPIPEYKPIARALSNENAPGGCSLLLTDLLGEQRTAAAMCNGRAEGATCLWVYTNSRQAVNRVARDGKVEKLDEWFVEALHALRPSFGPTAAHVATENVQWLNEKTGESEPPKHPGGKPRGNNPLKTADSVAHEMPTNDARARDSTVAPLSQPATLVHHLFASQAPFLGGNFAFEGTCRLVKHDEDAYGTVKATPEEADFYASLRAASSEDEAKVPYPYCNPARPSMEQVRATLRNYKRGHAHYEAACRRMAYARQPLTDEDLAGSSCGVPAPSVE
jgi:hypothetical protein